MATTNPPEQQQQDNPFYQAQIWAKVSECRGWVSDNQPPKHLAPFWPTKCHTTSESDNHGVNCLFGQLVMSTGDVNLAIHPCVVRFKDCGSKNGHPICLKLFGQHGFPQDRYQVLDLMMLNPSIMAIFLEGSPLEPQKPQWLYVNIKAPARSKSVRIKTPVQQQEGYGSHSKNWRSKNPIFTQKGDDNTIT